MVTKEGTTLACVTLSSQPEVPELRHQGTPKAALQNNIQVTVRNPWVMVNYREKTIFSAYNPHYDPRRVLNSHPGGRELHRALSVAIGEGLVGCMPRESFIGISGVQGGYGWSR